MNIPVLNAVTNIGGKLIDHFFPDAGEAERRKMELFALTQSGELKELEISMSAILAEANSSDKWTSRARPSFMYLFYFVIISLVVIFPIVGVFHPESMYIFYQNVKVGFEAIPEPMWWTFTAGYLGYATNRTYEKVKKVAK